MVLPEPRDVPIAFLFMFTKPLGREFVRKKGESKIGHVTSNTDVAEICTQAIYCTGL